ncbi:hypothetical protein [Shewanella sp. MBTL60-007]|uniref:hypothetical protein n=1 Tax=Shewanella sp. MBTL60-007 TaxID=2815911 RepID=UPI001BC0AD6E|nr:hypothetical protein [Shewanella sp. MBTL60-007]GIU16441.1 hypothetical protein TUM3792_10150 [Shewanella sp. MBTL60-007]
MNAKIKMLAAGLLCLNLSGCEYIENILHPDDDDEVIVDDNFRTQALQLGLSDETIIRLCAATDEISTRCISKFNDTTNQQEVRVEYTFNDVIHKNNYAKSTAASRVIFQLPADGATASITFENSRIYQFNDGYQYTWQEPTDFKTAKIAKSTQETIAELVNVAVTTRLSDSKLSNVSSATMSNSDYSLTEAQDAINAANTMLFPELIVNVTSNVLTEPTDASFAMFTAGHSAIFANYSATLATAIEQSWF